MSPTTLVFTAIPNPRFASTRRLTVLVSPRLTGGAPQLGAYELVNGSTTWPQIVDTLENSIAVSFGTGPSYRAHLAEPERPVAARSPALWTKIFPNDTPVRPWGFTNHHARPIQSFPAAKINLHLERLYKAIGTTSATDHPRLVPEQHGWIEALAYDLRELDERILREIDGDQTRMHDPWIEAGPYGNDGYRHDRIEHFWEALRFYRRRKQVGPGPRPLTVDDLPEFDFHDMVGLLGDHPLLLRKLGLIFDVVIPDGTPVPGNGTLRISLAWRGANHGGDKYPGTSFTQARGTWMAAPGPAGGFLAQNYLRLEDANQFPILQVDVDGGALKLIDFAAAVRAQTGSDTRSPAAETMSLPALRSG